VVVDEVDEVDEVELVVEVVVVDQTPLTCRCLFRALK